MSKGFYFIKTEQVLYVIRNIGRKKKQSFFFALCIIISSFIILSHTALTNGIQSKLKESINGAVSGQLTVYSSEEKGLNILESQLKDQKVFQWDENDDNELYKNILDISFFKRIRFGSLVSCEEETSYSFIHALEEKHLEKITNLISIKDGSIPLGDKELLISEALAKDLKCQVGDTLLLLAENLYGYTSDEVAIVSGIFEEKGLALLLFGMSFASYNLGKDVVLLEENERLELIINSVSTEDLLPYQIEHIYNYLFANYNDLNIAPWDKTVPLFFSFVKIWKGCNFFIQIIFVILSLIIFINLIFLVVFSRKKEFGTLLAMGFPWSKITFFVCLEYLILTVISILIGYSFTAGLIHILDGIYIPSKDLQSALMNHSLHLHINIQNIIYLLGLFSITTFFAVYFSILRIRKYGIITLIRVK